MHQNKGNCENTIFETIFQKISRIFQYYVHFTRNSYFLIIVPHIFWVRIFIYKGTFTLPAPLTLPPSGVPEYKICRNKLNHLIRVTKKRHFQKRLNDAKADLKSTWKILNELICKKGERKQLPSRFSLEDGSEINNPNTIANRFNEFFC
jgi:hypothetical protein